MNPKQFLKPTPAKIIITAIPSFLALFLSPCKGMWVPGVHFGSYPEICYSWYYFLFFPTNSVGWSSIDMIFYYLFSCLIVWIYDKLRGRKK